MPNIFIKKRFLQKLNLFEVQMLWQCDFPVFTFSGICGYLTFGDDVKSDILQSYNAKDMWVVIARVAIIIAMLTSYPIVHFCGR